MASRSRQDKKIRALRKALRQTPTCYINLIEWLVDRGYADTTGQAQELIKDGRVMAESHPLGLRDDLVSPLVPASLRAEIYVKE